MRQANKNTLLALEFLQLNKASLEKYEVFINLYNMKITLFINNQLFKAALTKKVLFLKNCDCPRQYVTLRYYFVWIFISLFPFRFIPEFATLAII